MSNAAGNSDSQRGDVLVRIRARCPECGVWRPTEGQWDYTDEGDRPDLCWTPGDHNCLVFREETFNRIAAVKP